MDELIQIIVKCIGVVLLGVCTYVVVPAIREWRQNKLTASQREELTFWTEMGVLWAKQWMQSASGEQKKAEVMTWLRGKMDELELPFTDDDLSKAIEAFYSTVKDVTDAAAGTDVTAILSADKTEG